ncbi:MAG: hypothetical protein Q9220_003094 [cf. Caloplaca sp. 1 TL-2023]
MARIHANRTAAAPVRTGLTLAKSNNVLYDHASRQYPLSQVQRSNYLGNAKVKQTARMRTDLVGTDMDQREIDARAAAAIRDLFPKIPEKDVQLIVAQAFQKVSEVYLSNELS